MAMTSSRAYLLRALNEWILDNNCTPYIVVNANEAEVRVPLEYVKDGQIVLNINPVSVRNLLVTNDAVSFEARFAGAPQSIYAPISAVTAIYAKENGQGMVFGWEDDPTDPDGPFDDDPGGKPTDPQPDKPTASKPFLKVVK